MSTKSNCSTVDPDMFFDVKHEDRAKVLCAGCPLRVACRDQARTNGEEYGVFGGEDPEQRARYLVANGRMERRVQAALIGERRATPLSLRLRDQGASYTEQQATKRAMVLALLKAENIGCDTIAARLGISKSAVVRIIKAHRAELAA